MSQIPANSSRPESSEAARRWIELAKRILVCGRLFRDDLTQQAGRWQLSEPEFAILWACHKAPSAGCSQKELAAVLAVSAAQVSGLVEQLRRQGLLEGRRGPRDRRRQFWRLTPAGRARLQSVLDDLARWAGPLNEQLGTGRSDALVRLLDQLAELLRTRPNTRPPATPAWKPLRARAVHGDAVGRDASRKGAA